MVKAAQSLAEKLQTGFIGTGEQKIPIAGDTTRLQFAQGLGPLERRLAQNMNFVAAQVPGTQQGRRAMGRSHFGARVVYGDCIFLDSMSK